MAAQRFVFEDVDEFVSDVVVIADTLNNLAFLIELDAQNPALVRQHAKQVSQLLEALGSRIDAARTDVCAGACS